MFIVSFTRNSTQLTFANIAKTNTLRSFTQIKEKRRKETMNKFEPKEDPPWVIILASVAVGASAAIVLFLALSGGL
jgi:hypothetical protein